jgi:hypothetical protein
MDINKKRQERMTTVEKLISTVNEHSRALVELTNDPHPTDIAWYFEVRYHLKVLSDVKNGEYLDELNGITQTRSVIYLGKHAHWRRFKDVVNKLIWKVIK